MVAGRGPSSSGLSRLPVPAPSRIAVPPSASATRQPGAGVGAAVLLLLPARYVGRRLSVRLAARTVETYDGPKLVARHERAVGRYVEVLTLDHHLEVLKTKPGWPPGVTALAQARASKAFTSSHQAYLDAARRARGAELLFQIITEREERASIAIATNLPFSEWARCSPIHGSLPPSLTASPSSPTSSRPGTQS